MDTFDHLAELCLPPNEYKINF